MDQTYQPVQLHQKLTPRMLIVPTEFHHIKPMLLNLGLCENYGKEQMMLQYVSIPQHITSIHIPNMSLSYLRSRSLP